MIHKLLLMVVIFFPFIQSAYCFSITGRAVQADGKTPAVDIIVQAIHMRDSVPGKKDEFIKTVTTGANGVFEMELPPLKDMYNVCLLDSKGHYYWGQAHINENIDLGTIKLERGCELSGKVRTKEGKALSGVEIQLKLKLKVCSHHVDAAKTTSAADGVFSFPDLSPGEYTYQLKGGTYSVKPGTINVSDDPSYLELTLEKAATIRGVVKDDHGKPVAGVHVSVEQNSVDTDPEGRYVIEGMPSGLFYVGVGGNGYVQKEGSRDRQVKCEPGKEVEKNFTVIKSGSLSVKIELTDKNEKLPAQLTVSFEQKTDRHSSSSTSRSVPVKDRKVVFKDLVPSDYTVTVKKGSGTWFVTNLTIIAGQELKQHVVLPHVQEIRGKVTDESGRPVPGASIRVGPYKDKSSEINESFVPHSSQQYLSSGKDGSFLVEGLTEGTKIRISVSEKNFTPANRVVEVRKEQPEGNFILGKGLKISGSVLESDGKSAQGIEVALSVRYDSSVGPAQYETMSSMSRSTGIDDKGGFELAGLVPGKYDLTFRQADDDTREADASLSGVEAGTDDVIVTLGKKQVITGKITDKEGKPLAKVNIDITKTQDGVSYGRYMRSNKPGKQSGTDGTFSLTARGGAKYSIGFNLYPYVQKTVSVDLGAGAQTPVPVNVELERGYKVSGLVTDDENKPVAGVTVNTSSQGSMFGGAMISEDGEEDETGISPIKRTNVRGEFSLDGVSPGIVSLVVSIKTNNTSRVLISKEIMVSRDQPNEAKVVLPGMGIIKGCVVDAQGKPMADSTVSLYSPKGGNSMSEQTDENGRFTIENVPEGSYMVMWYNFRGGSSGREMKPTAVVVRKGRTSEIILGQEQTAARGNTVNGIVKKEGTPVGKGTIMFSPLPKEDMDEMEMTSMYGSYVKGVIDDKGGFVVSNMTAGAYSYRVTLGKSAPVSTDDEGQAVSYFSGQFDLAAGQVAADINITGLTITGIVTGLDGKPASQCYVTATPVSAKSTTKWLLARYGVSDAQGKFKMECLPPGKYDIIANKESEGSGGYKNADLSKNSKPFDITLGPVFKLSGKVVMATGESSKGVDVFAISDDEINEGWAQVLEMGEYNMESKLPRGQYKVFASRKGFAVEAAILDINGDTKFNAKLVPSGNIQVRIIKGDQPVKGKMINLKTQIGEEVLRIKSKKFVGMAAEWNINPTDTDGRTTIYGIKPGKYNVYADGDSSTVSAEVKVLETTEVELKL